MIASRFRSVWMVGLVAGAALGCYLVSQRVATERAALFRLDRQIFAAERDIRTLSTEIAARSRLPQLEKWNVSVLGLTAPGAHQFLDSEIRLAALDGGQAMVPQQRVMGDPDAVRTVSFTPAPPAPVVAPQPNIVTVSAPVAPKAAPAPAAPEPMLRQATFVRAKPSALAPSPEPMHASVTKVAMTTVATPAKAPARSLSLLPDDIGDLAAIERGAGMDKPRRR
ncbi:hypothetical protein PQ455_01970 [Sphingomonas naphthae]|uniref:Uncharacterized protein n=1 Tax=Sphingomonas naphthae TaxID=1813468 RepID=A0ABY7TLV7_9SPHN|nr:hypothetical protein [Sphingomonas naphthae]WCT74023.1 hypothetical protein PQ455_01970 [Sphingomonas naphthae]